MATIARQALDSGPIDSNFWPRLAGMAVDWLRSCGVNPRDTVVLVPHAGLLSPARAGFAQLGGWQPRIETTRTLACALAPPTAHADGALSGDRATDQLTAAALLRRHAPGWIARNARAFSDAVDATVDTAAALRDAALARRPQERAAWWSALRADLPPHDGPGAAERWLARVALEWAAAFDLDAADALWAHRAQAWIAVSAGGFDALTTGLLAQAERVLWIDADGLPERPFDAAAALPPPVGQWAQGLEAEAQAAARVVLEALDRGRAPVALIAQDRLVVRRIRALLERSGVALADETGWALSTTRAGATVMALLRAALPGAGRDAMIEALKAESPAEAAALEDAWRHERDAPPEALAAQQAFRERLDSWCPPRLRSLGDWLAQLPVAAPRTIDRLAADSAGARVLAALRIDASAAPPGWSRVAAATRLDLHAFMAWVDQQLEGATYVAPATQAAEVVVLPLARAVLRPFGAVVMPGCDERSLGDSRIGTTLLPDALARRYGVPEATSMRQREVLSFAQLLRAPNLQLLRRTHDGDEPLAASALLQRVALARRRLGASPFVEHAAVAPRMRVERQPIERPAPSMADDLPRRVSASTVEALRECPYRFFARTALALTEPDELDAEVDKSDYGRWLHAVLHRFHEQRTTAADDRRASLLAIADEQASQMALDAAALLPFRAAFDTFVDHYLDWLREHEAAGWRYAVGEAARRCAPPDLGGLTLEGRLDRIDHHADGGAMLIDYKTGNADRFARRVRTPLEDTQLAFYAALLTDEPHEPPPRAIYLVLDERDRPKVHEHADVARSAAALVEGLGADFDALRRGDGAPALGEGEACAYCGARGLCRRDHWSAD
jgi:ATP-dependent helicase/nuclease subunit B